jgi:hypothetical protein
LRRKIVVGLDLRLFATDDVDEEQRDAGQHGQDDAHQGEDTPVHAVGQRRIGLAIARGARKQRRWRERSGGEQNFAEWFHR